MRLKGLKKRLGGVFDNSDARGPSSDLSVAGQDALVSCLVYLDVVVSHL